MKNPAQAIPVIQTFSGRFVNIFAPGPDDIVIEDMAHALSRLPLYAGQSRQFYSLAQRAVLAARLATPADKMAALLYNATDVYLTAFSPTFSKDNYQQLEQSLMGVIAEKYRFAYPFSLQVQTIHAFLQKREWNELVAGTRFNHFAEYTPAMAMKEFLDCFANLQDLA